MCFSPMPKTNPALMCHVLLLCMPKTNPCVMYVLCGFTSITMQHLCHVLCSLMYNWPLPCHFVTCTTGHFLDTKRRKVQVSVFFTNTSGPSHGNMIKSSRQLVCLPSHLWCLMSSLQVMSTEQFWHYDLDLVLTLHSSMITRCATISL